MSRRVYMGERNKAQRHDRRISFAASVASACRWMSSSATVADLRRKAMERTTHRHSSRSGSSATQGVYESSNALRAHDTAEAKTSSRSNERVRADEIILMIWGLTLYRVNTTGLTGTSRCLKRLIAIRRTYRRARPLEVQTMYLILTSVRRPR